MVLISLGGVVFFGHGGKAVEEKLGNVSQSDGVATGDAFAGELFDEIAQEEIHFIGGGKGVDVAEKLGGESFGIGSVAPGLVQPYMAETKPGAGVQDGQTALAPVDGGMSTSRFFLALLAPGGYEFGKRA